MPGDKSNSQPSPDHHNSNSPYAKLGEGQGVGDKSPSYYDISMLKAPVWTWEVAAYFFCGGVSAGAFVLSRLAERCGGERHQELTRAGTAVAVLAALPCAPLLIRDLGDPKRFHHMLRIWKPQSPMNLGSWTLTAYNGFLALAALRELARDGSMKMVPVKVPSPTEGLVLAVTDVMGVPTALLLAGYTGVLLSSTATPVWSRNPWLGPLFSASAMSTGAAAITLALETAAELSAPETPPKKALAKIESTARVAEAVSLAGYLASAGQLAEPLTRGKMAPHLWGGAVGAGLLVPEILERLPVRGKARRWLKIAAATLGLAGGFALRWAVLFAGRDSANDPDAARAVGRARDDLHEA